MMFGVSSTALGAGAGTNGVMNVGAEGGGTADLDGIGGGGATNEGALGLDGNPDPGICLGCAVGTKPGGRFESATDGEERGEKD